MRRWCSSKEIAAGGDEIGIMDGVAIWQTENSASLCLASSVGDNKHACPMDAVSRREEDNLLKLTKQRALKECDAVVRGM